MGPKQAAEMRQALVAFASRKPVMAKARIVSETVASPHGVVLPYKPAAKRATPARATLKMPVQRQAMAAAR